MAPRPSRRPPPQATVHGLAAASRLGKAGASSRTPKRLTGVQVTRKEATMKLHRLSLVTAALLIAVSAGAQKAPHYPIEQFTLKNGLRVVVSPDQSAPVVGLALAYDVGSRNEVRGRTGFAH